MSHTPSELWLPEDDQDKNPGTDELTDPKLIEAVANILSTSYCEQFSGSIAKVQAHQSQCGTCGQIRQRIENYEKRNLN